MRYAIGLFLCCSYFCAGQTSQDLRSRYGSPDVERFIARPDITATVEYGNNGSMCQVVIEALKPLVRRDQTLRHIRSDAVSAIIEEIVPRNSRGRELNTLKEYMGCAHGETTEYENVVISRSWDQCTLSPERESMATVTRKRGGCPPALIFSKQRRPNNN